MRRRISRAQQTKNWCVGFSFPPPAYAGIHPTLYLFGFRADALNSHSPPYLPGFDPRSCLERFDTFSGSSGKVVGFSCRGLRSSEAVRGPPGPLGGFRGLWCPRFAFEASGGLPRASPGASGVPPGASGGLGAPPGGLGGPRGFFFWVWTLGLVVGFAFFGLRPQPPAWRIPNFSIFQATSWRRLASGRPERRPENPRDQGRWVFLSRESQKRRRGPLGGAPAPAPGGAAHALNHSLGLHSTSKQWCESLPEDACRK